MNIIIHYQVYEDLFKVYVTRVNFKMRMRKLHIRSIRAAPIVRVKLIEIGALPSHCPVCGLILVSQVESLAKSYGVVPPNVMYEAFLSSAVHVASMVGNSLFVCFVYLLFVCLSGSLFCCLFVSFLFTCCLFVSLADFVCIFVWLFCWSVSVLVFVCLFVCLFCLYDLFGAVQV